MARGEACAPLPNERVIAPANCSALRRPRVSHRTSKAHPPLKFMMANILRFAYHGQRLIRHGSGTLTWTGPLVTLLSDTQVRHHGFHGAVGEIGVHHGMFAIAVAHTARRGELVFAVDLFDKLQRLNVDSSGSGDLRKFLRNTARFGVDRRALDLHVGPSTSLPLQYQQPLRLFSVDGGHTESITASDLAWAACNSIDGGIIMLDDFRTPAWPGVEAGARRHLHCGASRPLTPFANVEGKLYFTTSPQYAMQYQRALTRSAFFGRRLQYKTVLGYRVLARRERATRETTEAELIDEWHRLLLRARGPADGAHDVDERLVNASGKRRGVAPVWSTRLAAEAAVGKWLPPTGLAWAQEGLLWLMDTVWPQTR
jgi:hypothetical protein